jgi:hydroxymethylglutaryl-CoA reductase
MELAERLIENAVGVFGMPLGVATNFIVDGRELLVPMAIEEPSVVAAASNAARMIRAGGGFRTQADEPRVMAQIELIDPADDAATAITAAKDELLALANATQPELVSLGGGARDLQVRCSVGGKDRSVAHLEIDCLDAMGANIANTMAEAVAPRLAALSSAKIGLRILTNLADRRLASAEVLVPTSALGRTGYSGEAVAAGVEAASRFAEADPYRATTHNKGIFNGVDALLLATGNDWRAVEAGGHAFTCRSGRYCPLSTFRVAGDALWGKLEMPMAVGIVGGASRTHPVARFALELLGVTSGQELARIAVSVGLASNLAALAALSSEGIQRGHMRLHERRSQDI